MAKKYYTKNIRPFTAICDGFGREVIYTRQPQITLDNVIEELGKALSIHVQNVREIEYLNAYYTGDQPILYRRKKNRPEINNKIVVNLAQYLVDVNASNIVNEPVQFVLKATDEKKSEELRQLNTFFDENDKECDDIELCRWRSICGTAYRFIGNSKSNRLFATAPFTMKIESPTDAFVCYYEDDTPAFGCVIRKDVQGNEVYWVYTPTLWVKVIKGEIIESGLNGNGAIPVIEYPNNLRRLSDIEITISLTDEINKLASDRGNGIEQYVQSWIKFINCDIDIEKFRQVRDEGFFSVTSNNGAENRSDVDIMSQELDQTQAQVAVDDLFNKLLIIQGIANREGNTGGDTGNAVELRNGWTAQDRKAKFNEPIFKRSEREMLRLVINRLRIENGVSLVPTDIEIKVTRSKNVNMLTKAEVLKILLDCGVDESIAIKTVDLFSDPEQVAYESKERMRKKYEVNNDTNETLEENNLAKSDE